MLPPSYKTSDQFLESTMEKKPSKEKLVLQNPIRINILSLDFEFQKDNLKGFSLL